MPHTIADGPENMAVDEMMLDIVAKAPDQTIFRTYEWSVPTLSLGYFQTIQEVEADSRWRDVAVVRRLTGGGAILHHHEITYAIVLPTSHHQSGRGGQFYRAVHAVIAETLRERLAPVERRGETSSGLHASRPFLCFADRDPEDLVMGNHKVVGSAQRRRARAVLQHGSVLLEQSNLAPELPGLAEVSGTKTAAIDWADLLRERILRALELSPRHDVLSEEETRHIHALANDVYRNTSWTNRR